MTPNARKELLARIEATEREAERLEGERRTKVLQELREAEERESKAFGAVAASPPWDVDWCRAIRRELFDRPVRDANDEERFDRLLISTFIPTPDAPCRAIRREEVDGGAWWFACYLTAVWPRLVGADLAIAEHAEALRLARAWTDRASRRLAYMLALPEFPSAPALRAWADGLQELLTLYRALPDAESLWRWNVYNDRRHFDLEWRLGFPGEPSKEVRGRAAEKALDAGA